MQDVSASALQLVRCCSPCTAAVRLDIRDPAACTPRPPSAPQVTPSPFQGCAPRRCPPSRRFLPPTRADSAPTGWPAGPILHSLSFRLRTPLLPRSVSFPPDPQIARADTCPADTRPGSRSIRRAPVPALSLPSARYCSTSAFPRLPSLPTASGNIPDTVRWSWPQTTPWHTPPRP